MRRMIRRFLWTLAFCGVAALILAGAAALVLRTAWFRDQVRERIIAATERATGGRVELADFRFDWNRLHAEAGGFVLHGLEPVGEEPLLRTARVSVDLKILSLLRRDIDVTGITVEAPRLRIVNYPDGTSNLPRPKTTSPGRPWPEQLLRLSANRLEINDGWVEFDQRRIPLAIRADGIKIGLDYETQGPRYRGTLAARALEITAAKFLPMIFTLDAELSLEKDRILFPKLDLQLGRSPVRLTGELTALRTPRGRFATRAQLDLRDLQPIFRLPLAPRGTAKLEGETRVSFLPSFDYSFTGALDARGLALDLPDAEVRRADLQGAVTAGLHEVKVTRMRAAVDDGVFRGDALIRDWRTYEVTGALEAFPVHEAVRIARLAPLPWDAAAAGPLRLRGNFPRDKEPVAFQASAEVSLAPLGDGPAVSGEARLAFTLPGAKIEIADAVLTTPRSRIEAGGVVGDSLTVRLRTSNLREMEPWIARFGDPVQLPAAAGEAEGSVNGPLRNPRISARVRGTGIEYQGFQLDAASARVELDASRLQLSAVSLRRANLVVEGEGTAAFQDWRLPAGTLDAAFRFRGGDLAALLRDAKVDFSGTGAVSGEAIVKGPAREPQIRGVLEGRTLNLAGQAVDTATARFRYAAPEFTLDRLDAARGAARLTGSGVYRHAADQFRDGRARLQVDLTGLPLDAIDPLRSETEGWNALLSLKAAGRLRLAGGKVQLEELDGSGAAEHLRRKNEPVGRLAVTARSQNQQVSFDFSGAAGDSRLSGSGLWSLAGERNGSAKIVFSPLTFREAQRIATAGETKEDPPPGFLQGAAEIRGSLDDLASLRAQVTLDRVEVVPPPEQMLRLGVRSADLALKNAAPVTVELSRAGARITDARFQARDTEIQATGLLSFSNATPSDLRVQGGINLGILQLLNPDLLAQGRATVQAVMRGSLEQPKLSGRLELKNASLYLADLPNGIDNASGVINFDQTRATIESLVAETGGGRITFSGFVGLSTSALVYRVQAQARQVRVRYPRDFSFVFNSDLSLSGTSQRSLLTGSVNVVRASFTPRADLAEFFTQSIRPSQPPAASNEYLRGMQLDVQINNDPGLQVQTSLTRDVLAEADLHLRGSALRPVLLGTISVNQGEVQVLGTRYSVNRGEIRFLNAQKIEPVFDLDLETRARGITVNIAFAGTPSKVDVTYRSDPPLQTQEIISLLAVGRDPGATTGRLTNPANPNATAQLGASVLSEAVSAQLGSRLQRFFGITRVKIDPSLNGIENLPQARLTLEQQLSKDITVTYITNLTRTQEQNVRVQWDLNKEWSVLAVREETGVIGLFFQYRKRFK